MFDGMFITETTPLLVTIFLLLFVMAKYLTKQVKNRKIHLGLWISRTTVHHGGRLNGVPWSLLVWVWHLSLLTWPRTIWWFEWEIFPIGACIWTLGSCCWWSLGEYATFKRWSLAGGNTSLAPLPILPLLLVCGYNVISWPASCSCHSAFPVCHHTFPITIDCILSGIII